jgi:hypothetical protein
MRCLILYGSRDEKHEGSKLVHTFADGSRYYVRTETVICDSDMEALGKARLLGGETLLNTVEVP